ncbi:MAG: hypothetical protein LBV63_00725 [Candidatus Methanoplasma sp.]|jgi:hypothetical protein|nr:hypothetical protein [Candidatus Methanoplasma sp.]
MLFDRSKGVPAEVSKVDLTSWYNKLNDQEKVKLGRYISGSDTSSKAAFAVSVMKKANEDHSFSISAVTGENILASGPKDADRFDVLEEIILAYYGMSKYDECLESCESGLKLVPKLLNDIKARNGGVVPERLNCRNYKINVLVGIRYDYDAGDRALEEFHKLGILSAEDMEFRKRSHRIYRLQKSFDGIFSVKIKDV